MALAADEKGIWAGGLGCVMWRKFYGDWEPKIALTGVAAIAPTPTGALVGCSEGILFSEDHGESWETARTPADIRPEAGDRPVDAADGEERVHPPLVHRRRARDQRAEQRDEPDADQDRQPGALEEATDAPAVFPREPHVALSSSSRHCSSWSSSYHG